MNTLSQHKSTNRDDKTIAQALHRSDSSTAWTGAESDAITVINYQPNPRELQALFGH